MSKFSSRIFINCPFDASFASDHPKAFPSDGDIYFSFNLFSATLKDWLTDKDFTAEAVVHMANSEYMRWCKEWLKEVKHSPPKW